ncbi:MAG: type II secretion system protein GspG [Polyangiaceae bacterium]|nr:type II secretion system protein GspG [Polyangiaceae bacterium]
MGRVRLALGVLAIALLAIVLRRRENHKANLRTTRASLLLARRAVDAYRADHALACPKAGWGELVAAGYLPRVPEDAWRRPLRLTCPAARPERAYDVSSDGPDGEPGGLDRVD